MSEHITSHTSHQEKAAIEIAEQFGERADEGVTELLNSFVSEDGRQKLRESIDDELEQSSAYQHFSQIERDDKRARESDDGSDFRITKALLDEHKSRKDLAISLWGEESYERYEYLKAQKDSIEQYERVYVRGDEAVEIIEGLFHSDEGRAQRMALFVDPERLRKIQDRYNLGTVELRTTRTNKEVELPLHRFISAESMSSWYGRGVYDERTGRFSTDGQGSKERGTSREHIERIAEIEEGIPEIEDVTAYATKDGYVFMKSNNAHRVAAAILKGEANIAFRGVMTVNVLNVTSEEFLSSVY